MGLNWVLTFMWEIFLKTKIFLRNYCTRLLKFKTSISIPENLKLVAYVGALPKLKKNSPITQISDVFFHLYLFLKDFDPIVNYRLPSLKSMRCAIVITSIAKKNIQRALSYESFGFEIALRLEQVENQSLHSSAATTSHFNMVLWSLKKK